MCDYEDFQFICGHSTARLLSYCHFARTDPYHQCFSVKVIRNTWVQSVACQACVEAMRAQAAKREKGGRWRRWWKDGLWGWEWLRRIGCGVVLQWKRWIFASAPLGGFRERRWGWGWEWGWECVRLTGFGDTRFLGVVEFLRQDGRRYLCMLLVFLVFMHGAG